jgi:hypothetical protein
LSFAYFNLKLLQITPRVPPSACGVADYSWILADELKTNGSIVNEFICCGNHQVQPIEKTLHEVTSLRTSKIELLKAVEERWSDLDAVLLHVSLYGYNKRGIPWWIGSAWQEMSRKRGNPKLLTFFHELYADSSLYHSAFWLKPLQKLILRRLRRASHYTFTNRQAYASWLDSDINLNIKTAVLPVFSNLGESENPISLSDRSNEMAMFIIGHLFDLSQSDLVMRAADLASKLGFTKLHVLGKVDGEINCKTDLEVVLHGRLPAQEISKILSDCRMGYLSYTPEYLAKSGLLAAYAAHGLAVAVSGTASPLHDGLMHGHNIYFEEDFKKKECLDFDSFQVSALNLHEWYRGHSRSKVASEIRSTIVQ